MKRNVFAKKIHADEATFHLLHLDLEFAARLKWHQFQIPSQHYFLLGLHTTCSFLERKAPAVSNMPKGCGAALGDTELATKDCSHSFHGTKPHQMKAWRVNRNRLNPVTTQCCRARTQNALPPYQIKAAESTFYSVLAQTGVAEYQPLKEWWAYCQTALLNIPGYKWRHIAKFIK